MYVHVKGAQNIMWKIFGTFLLILTGAFLLFPQSDHHESTPAPIGDAMDPEHEIAIKQSILVSDVQVTDQLCRSQCQFDLFQATQLLQPFSLARIEQSLTEIRSQHPHMELLQWISFHDEEFDSVTAGQLSEEVAKSAEKYIEHARHITRNGEIYQSETFLNAEGAHYFVMGIPAERGQSSLVGVIHQDIIKRVQDHQTNNLRIANYPAKKQWKMEAVDPETLQDKEVQHPEDNEGTSHYHANEVVVKFKKHLTEAELREIMSDINGLKVRQLDHTYIFLTERWEARQLMEYFQRRDDVVYAEPHFIYLTNDIIPFSENVAVPNDALYSQYQWNLPIIQAERGWDISKGAVNVPVAIVDTGVDLEHPDLNEHLWKGYNAVRTNSLPMDDVGHGTHVAGVVAAQVNNHIGVAGLTWVNPVIPVKVLDESGAGSTYAVAQGIIWATDNGARVINLSLGNYADANFLHDAIKYAFDRDVVLVAASGNDNTETPGYPAAYPEVLAVGATDHLKRRASFSNYGHYIDVVAPGQNIASTFPGSQYAAMSGTSMASPHVAALAALIRSVNPLLKNTEVMEIIKQTAEDLGDMGKDPYFGHGQIDIKKALQSADAGINTLSLWPQWLSRQYELIEAKYALPSS